MPGLTKCNIAEMVSILNFLYSTKLLNLFKFKIRRKPPSDFLPTNIGEINSLGSCFVSTITNLALISAATNSCSFFAKWVLVQFHCWKVVSYFSMHSRYCSQDLSVRCKFLPLFQAERKGSTLEWLNSVRKVFSNVVKVFYLQFVLEGNQCFFGFQLELRW